jgi:hypothetical protein
VRLALAFGILPRLRGYFRPGYHPSQFADPPALRWWLARYAAGADLRTLAPSALDAADAG